MLNYPSQTYLNPYNGNQACNPCQYDPLYNSQPVPMTCAQPCAEPCARKKCKKTCNKKNCRKCRKIKIECEPNCGQACAPQCAPQCPPQCAPCAAPCPPPMPCKDPCPLKSFCDPALGNTCASRPIIDLYSPKRAVPTWKVNFLVSNQTIVASHVDPELINPWGIVIYNNQLWVANNGTDRLTNYDLFGNRLLASVSVREPIHDSAFPTGIAINCGAGFNIGNGAFTRAGLFIVVTETGTVHVYNPTIDPLNSVLVLNHQLGGEVAKYKGLAVANGVLYLADFFQGHIDVFDSNFIRLLGYRFIDGDTSDPIPLDYGPTNIVHIGCFLYVIWARRHPDVSIHAIDGPGAGYISIFGLDGGFIRRFTSRGVLNNPWAMIPAPCDCGFPPGSFLVSNHGDGRINVFDCNGRYVGPLLNPAGLPIAISGLRGLAPHYVDFNEIYFTAAYEENIEGMLGNITRDQIIYF